MSVITKGFDKLYKNSEVYLSRSIALGGALLFGIFLILVVGFSEISSFHNIAHDGRHALAFPCH
tara:strand:+ start:328 stop:519 length:192 start_codon:yes stop_codon:yes gene_type:complete